MITAGLRDLGWRVSKNTVAAVMAEMGLAARPKKKRKGTTRPGKGRWRAPCPAASCTPTRAAEGVRRGLLQGRLPAAFHLPVHGPARVGAG